MIWRTGGGGGGGGVKGGLGGVGGKHYKFKSRKILECVPEWHHNLHRRLMQRGATIMHILLLFSIFFFKNHCFLKLCDEANFRGSLSWKNWTFYLWKVNVFLKTLSFYLCEYTLCAGAGSPATFSWTSLVIRSVYFFQDLWQWEEWKQCLMELDTNWRYRGNTMARIRH